MLGCGLSHSQPTAEGLHLNLGMAHVPGEPQGAWRTFTMEEKTLRKLRENSRGGRDAIKGELKRGMREHCIIIEDQLSVHILRRQFPSLRPCLDTAPQGHPGSGKLSPRPTNKSQTSGMAGQCPRFHSPARPQHLAPNECRAQTGEGGPGSTSEKGWLLPPFKFRHKTISGDRRRLTRERPAPFPTHSWVSSPQVS